jgi:hypothetical protein
MPGVSVVQEELQTGRVKVDSTVLRQVAELFGFNVPARTVDILEAARQRTERARRRQEEVARNDDSGWRA